MGVAHERPLTGEEIARLNAARAGLEARLGIRYTYLSATETRAELTLSEHTQQPFGVTHGGVYAALAESVGSIASVVSAGQPMVGVNNDTDFLRSTESGVLEARALPLHAGRRTQLWEVTISNEGRVVAVSRLRTMRA